MSIIKTATYIIPGDPIPLQRPRFGKHRVYDSQKNAKLNWELQLTEQNVDIKMFSGPLWLDVIFYMEIPSTATKKSVDKLLNSFHVFRPDLSNLVKFAEDCCNEVLYKDDCQIAKISAEKRYDVWARTEITITEIQR